MWGVSGCVWCVSTCEFRYYNLYSNIGPLKMNQYLCLTRMLRPVWEDSRRLHSSTVVPCSAEPEELGKPSSSCPFFCSDKCSKVSKLFFIATVGHSNDYCSKDLDPIRVEPSQRSPTCFPVHLSASSSTLFSTRQLHVSCWSFPSIRSVLRSLDCSLFFLQRYGSFKTIHILEGQF